MNPKITIDSDYEICFDYTMTFEEVLMNCAQKQTAYELIDGASKVKYSVVYENNKLKFKFPKEILLKDVLSLPKSLELKLTYHQEMMNLLINQNFKNPSCIEFLQYSPTHLIFGLNFKGFGGLCLFCISKFVGNSLFLVSDRCFKLYFLQSEKCYNYLKSPSLNMNILVQCHNQGLDKLAIQMYHTFIPTQIFQNIMQDDSLVIHHFLPTQEFGIFNFSNDRLAYYQVLMNPHQIVVQITTKFDGNKFNFQMRQGNSYNMIMSVKSEIDFRIYYDLFTTKMAKSLEFERFEEIQQFFQKFILFTTIYLYAQDFKEYFFEVLSKLVSEKQTSDFIRYLQMKIAKNMSMFQQKDLKIQRELYKSQFRDLNMKACQQYLQQSQ